MKLKLLRKAANMTQQQLADKCGINRVTLARIETEACKPSFDSLRAIARALDCSVDALLNESAAS